MRKNFKKLGLALPKIDVNTCNNARKFHVSSSKQNDNLQVVTSADCFHIQGVGFPFDYTDCFPRKDVRLIFPGI